MKTRIVFSTSISMMAVLFAGAATALTPATLIHESAQELPVSISFEADYNPHWGKEAHAEALRIVPLKGLELSAASESVGKITYRSLGVKGVVKVTPGVNVAVGVKRIPIGLPIVQRQVFGVVQAKLGDKAVATVGIGELYGKYSAEAALAYAVSPGVNLIGEYREGGYGLGTAFESGGFRGQISYQKQDKLAGVAASVGYQIRF